MTVQEAIEFLMKLPSAQRREIADQLARDDQQVLDIIEPNLEALRRFLGRAGTGVDKDGATDVSSNKHKYLTEIYATKK